MPPGPSVLIVEDDLAIRRLTRAALTRAGYRASEAATAREALAIADVERPEVLLLDLGLPDRDGLELIQLLKSRVAVVIVVSARTDTDDKVAALDLGADDYLTKPFDTEELLARVRTALRHRRVGSDLEAPLTLGEVTVDVARRLVMRGGVAVHLTPKEYGLLVELCRQPGRIVGHAALLRAVWGPAHETHLEYLRIAVRALRQKLEADPARPRLILNEAGVGYRVTDPAQSPT